MEPLGESSNTPRGAPLSGTRKSGKKSGMSRDRRRSLLTPDGNGTPSSAGRRNGSRLGERRLATEMESQAGRRAPQANLLDPEQVAALYHQCIKLATENKISSKNTWALGLIDHLHDLVQPTEQEGSTTNFQRASVTLGAGIEIYAKRVDSIHTEAFKVLGGLCRGGAAMEGDGTDDSGNADDDESGDGRPDNGRAARKAAMLRDVNPSSTLEPSFDSLNVKKIDLAFTVDPLFHKTSAQFDEGGARGLLLFNLNVGSGCEIVFDSQEVHDGSALSACQPEENPQVDVGPLAGQIADVMAASRDARMCPAMDELSALLGRSAEKELAVDAERLVAMVPDFDRMVTPSGGRQAPNGADSEMRAAKVEGHESEGDESLGDGGSFATHVSDEEDADDSRAEMGGGDASDWAHSGEVEGMEGGDGPTWMTQQPFETQGAAAEDFSADQEGAASDLGTHLLLEEHTSGFHASQEQSGMDAVQWLVSGVENLNLEGRDWAGASHWRYRTPQNPEGDPGEASAAVTAKQPKPKRKRGDPLDFNNLSELPERALALADAKTITLKTWGSKAPTLLPEDLHYKASSLAELFLKPGRLIFASAEASQHGAVDSDRDLAPASAFGEEFAEEHGEDDEDGPESGGWGDVDFGDLAGLVEAPRKVAQIGINYARAAKQVDVRALKQTLWHVIGEQHDQQQAGGGGEEVAFQNVLGQLFPDNVSGSISDLSVHLCFICLLHLANENGLRITGKPTLDCLSISGVPSAATV